MGAFQLFYSALAPLSSSLSWTAISSIGKSNVARLTILTPILGYLVLYNNTLNSALELSAPLNSSIEAATGLLSSLHSRRMDFLYFGLLSLGCGVGLFSLFAPGSVRRHSDEIAFVEAKMKICTPLLIHSSLTSVIERYLRSVQGEQRSPFFGRKDSLAFPSNIDVLLHRLAEKIYTDSGFDEDPEISFRTGSGYIDTAAVIETMSSTRAVDRIYWGSFLQSSEAFPKDIFVLEFLSDNFMLPGIRLLSGFFFLVGFLLLLVPTVTVTLIIVYSWLA